ncbi:CAMKK/ELM protein kinase Ssp1 [Schizosaccharomyces japonicus yFS275]|uniref:non-specific serine/threonine protein kinase n=1 Tax=Schizosaccharomyces japonicus (strain yFS275 / FY16936) TaxID=402676 RepID=B6K4D0_SCHJY|nr:CAMKK/ELM protein kinase Ssp1 [Schizosaccharomyces japonicus yFS275]EEB08337.2 CAMKK/ELM protein kinase Ssp1 [Schizosaccharomyces japonicus yFS275]
MASQMVLNHPTASSLTNSVTQHEAAEIDHDSERRTSSPYSRRVSGRSIDSGVRGGLVRDGGFEDIREGCPLQCTEHHQCLSSVTEGRHGTGIYGDGSGSGGVSSNKSNGYLNVIGKDIRTPVSAAAWRSQDSLGHRSRSSLPHNASALHSTADFPRKRNYSFGGTPASANALHSHRGLSTLTHSWTFQPGVDDVDSYNDNFDEVQLQWKRLQEWGEVKETKKIRKRFDKQSGRKVINHYEILREIGRGMHGKVKLGRDVETGEHVAIKIIEKIEPRPKLGHLHSSSQRDKVHREIAILKKCKHPNVVRLREVIDDPASTKVYLVLEYMSGGELQWTSFGEPVLSVDEARKAFRDVVLGLEYLHYQGIIHRDIKPANLLLNSVHCVKISDFGVSFIASQGMSEDSDVELAKTVGTPAFFAPELCWTDIDRPRPKITEAIDVWALGATLYCLLFGRCPFEADVEFELFDRIVNQELEIPAEPDIGDDGRDLLSRLLAKDPKDRITLAEAKRHSWTLRRLKDPKTWVDSTDPKALDRVKVSSKDVASAISIVERIRRKLGKLFHFTRKSLTQTVTPNQSDNRVPAGDAVFRSHSAKEPTRANQASDAHDVTSELTSHFSDMSLGGAARMPNAFSNTPPTAHFDQRSYSYDFYCDDDDDDDDSSWDEEGDSCNFSLYDENNQTDSANDDSVLWIDTSRMQSSPVLHNYAYPSETSDQNGLDSADALVFTPKHNETKAPVVEQQTSNSVTPSPSQVPSPSSLDAPTY